MKTSYITVFSSLFLTLIISCGTIKPGNAQKSGGLYETFYTGETGLQYFIKPLSFENKEKKEEVLLDIVFRDNEIETDSAVINMTFVTTNKLTVGENVIVKTSESQIHLVHKRQIYKEREKEMYVVRIEGKCTKKELFTILEQSPTSIDFNSEGVLSTFAPKKNTTKRIAKIASGVIS